MDLYFECNSGISGDMSTAALLDLGASQDKLEQTLKSMNLDNEFKYEIEDVLINSIKVKDFNVILPEHHEHHHDCEHHHHRNLDDVNNIINKAQMEEDAKNLSKKIFKIVAQAEARVHNKDIKDIHFHEIGAIDSIVDIVSFSVLFCDLNPNNVYFSTLTEGVGTVECQHGILSVPVPAVCEILSEYKIPFRISDNNGEMITPTGAAIVAALYNNKKLPDEIVLEKIGYGAGKRKYKNPILRVMKIKGE